MSPAKPEANEPSEKRRDLLDSAAQIFLRFGYKKTSMDDVARAAGLSRQGLYLHFSSKEQLFRAAVKHLLESGLRAARQALNEDLPLPQRLVNCFTELHGMHLGDAASAHMVELMDAAASLLGPDVLSAHSAIVDDIARVLKRELPARRGVTARDRALALEAASVGLKHTAPSRAAFRDRLAVIVQVVCNGPSP